MAENIYCYSVTRQKKTEVCVSHQKVGLEPVTIVNTFIGEAELS
jgi:hypothetical protein